MMRFSSFLRTNDPRESKIWRFSYDISGYNKTEIPDVATKIQQEIQERIKVVCFTRDDPTKFINGSCKFFYRGYSHPRMWAQYGFNHSGVCLIFNKNILRVSIYHDVNHIGQIYEGPVRYRDPDGKMKEYSLSCKLIDKLGEEDFIKQYFEKNHKALFFTKLKDWQSELEYRWVLLGKDSSYEYFSIISALEGIVLGADFPEEYLHYILDICAESSIPVIKLDWHNGYPTPITFEGYPRKHQSFV